MLELRWEMRITLEIIKTLGSLNLNAVEQVNTFLEKYSLSTLCVTGGSQPFE